MKIAVVTDDGKTISAHFGRANYYQVVTVEDGDIKDTEMREKSGHFKFQHQHHDEHSPSVSSRGHGFGETSERKHALMAEAISDCEAILTRGMGRGAYINLEEAGIKPVVTDIESIEEAVKAYIDGNIVDRVERLH